MESAYWQIYLHLVWSTENRKNSLRGHRQIVVHEAIRRDLRSLEMVPICVNSAWNHVHCLVSWNPKVAVDDAVESSKEAAVNASEKASYDDEFDATPVNWQEGWSAFSVSPGKVDYAKWYVAHQKELHRGGRTIDRYETCKGELSGD